MSGKVLVLQVYSKDSHFYMGCLCLNGRSEILQIILIFKTTYVMVSGITIFAFGFSYPI